MPRPKLPSLPPDEFRCTAKAKSTGNRCTKWALKGLKVCKVHGGNTKAARAAGLERHAKAQATKKIEAAANRMLAHEGLEPVEDPLHELGKLANVATELMHSLGARVNALNAVEHMDLKDTPQIRIEAEMYERAIDRTARLLDMLVKHGYTERQVKIAETEALMIAGILTRVLSGLGLEAAQLTQAKSLLADEFRQLQPHQALQGQVTPGPDTDA